MDSNKLNSLVRQYASICYGEQYWRVIIKEFMRRKREIVVVLFEYGTEYTNNSYHGTSGRIVQKEGQFVLIDNSLEYYSLPKPEFKMKFEVRTTNPVISDITKLSFLQFLQQIQDICKFDKINTTVPNVFHVLTNPSQDLKNQNYMFSLIQNLYYSNNTVIKLFQNFDNNLKNFPLVKTIDELFENNETSLAMYVEKCNQNQDLNNQIDSKDQLIQNFTKQVTDLLHKIKIKEEAYEEISKMNETIHNELANQTSRVEEVKMQEMLLERRLLEEANLKQKLLKENLQLKKDFVLLKEQKQKELQASEQKLREHAKAQQELKIKLENLEDENEDLQVQVQTFVKKLEEKELELKSIAEKYFEEKYKNMK